MGKQEKWLTKMLSVYLAEAAPREGDEKFHDAIGRLAALHMAGQDHRKVGRFAAAMYELSYKNRRQIIDDMAKLATAS